MSKATKSVLITGCSDGGLGAALATAFHEAGLKVYATARDVSKMSHLKSLGIDTLELDVLSDSSIARCVEQIPSLDILVNNAGCMYHMPVSDLSIAEAKRVFDLNVWSYVTVSQAFLQLLIQSKGIIANQTSVLSLMATPFSAVYNSSKAAMAMISDTMRLELEPFGVRVIDLKTGLVNSNLFNNAKKTSTQRLPGSSIYGVARDRVEGAMRGEGFEGQGMDPRLWSKSVVRDMLKTSPASQIWRGGNATLVWLLGFLPRGTTDGTVKKSTGIDVVAAALKSTSKY